MVSNFDEWALEEEIVDTIGLMTDSGRLEYENDESAGASNLFYGYPTDFYGRFCYFGWRNGYLGD